MEPARHSSQKRNVLLIVNLLWDDARDLLIGVSQYVQGAWNVTLDVDAAALNDSSWLERHRWNGVICRHTTEAFAQACLERGIPLVDLEDRPTLAGVPSVRPDNRAVGHMGAEHLLERGFRSFAFCGLTESWSRERFEGFREALRLVGMGSELFESEYHGFDPNWNDREHTKLVGWLRDLPRPLAVMTCNDLRALQVSRACRELGALVPHEIAILGVNNDVLRSAFGSPPISSVATDLNLAGFRAAEMLDRLMRAGLATSDEQIRIDPLKVVVRGSTDVLAVEDKVVRSALHFIREFACKGITAQDVAQHVGVSRYALERKFNQYVSRSPHAEIRAVQIARIKQLLTESDMPLKNIADLVGIQHPEYVNVMFSREVGMPPGAYRRLHQAKKVGQRASQQLNPMP